MRSNHSTHMTLVLLPAILVAAVLNGCAADSAARVETTMLESVDLVRMTDQMAESLLSSEVALIGIVVVTDRVVNRTNHLMRPGEKELFLNKLRATLGRVDSLRQAGVVFVARPDELTEFHPAPGVPGRQSGPTHALTATFYSLTLVDRRHREDTYECAFQLQDLATRRIIWEDAYEVSYAVQRGRFQ